MREERCPRCSELHRKLQKAEGEIIRLKRKLEALPVNPWASQERQAEAVERDQTAAVIDLMEALRSATKSRRAKR